MEAEWDYYCNHTAERRLRNAKFRYQSGLENTDYEADRNLDRNQMMHCAEYTYIRRIRYDEFRWPEYFDNLFQF